MFAQLTTGILNIHRSLTGVYGRMAGVKLPFGHENVNTDAKVRQYCSLKGCA